MKHIGNEEEFEKRIREIIDMDIISKHPQFGVLDMKKTTDLTIFRNGENPKLFFLEAKYYDRKHGRLGFGHAKGKGFQPEVLRRNPDFFKSNMRWVLGSLESELYFFADNDTMLQFISGGEIGNKQNNFQSRLFNEIPGLTKTQLTNELINWLIQ